MNGLAEWLAQRQSECPPSTRLSPGEIVGEWKVTAYLGAGLSAEVYRVVNVRFAREGALKLLRDTSRGLRERFLAESDAIRFLSLRALPQFMGSGEHGVMPYYVMEYLQPVPDPMPSGDVPRFMTKVAKAVHALHEAGYVHRDLKPANILMRRTGEPVLIDLGLVKRRGTGGAFPQMRPMSMVDGRPVGVGTVDYSAPEQLLKGQCSVQCDVFALGKLLRHFYGDYPPGNIKAIVRRATRETPGDRYRTAAAFAAALRHRNRGRWVALFLLTAFTVVGAGAFHHRHELMRRLSLQTSVLALTRKPNEADAAYFNRILPLAEGGNAQAQIALAEAYFYGRGTPTNRNEAVRWYRLAADRGEPDAQASLGLCAFRGWGCQKDLAAAVRWYSLAAEKGHLGAMNDLAFCQLNGIGMDKDEVAGFELAMKAALRGHAASQTMVGECYLDGRGTERDVSRAETWLYRAARQDNKRAQTLLRER